MPYSISPCGVFTTSFPLLHLTAKPHSGRGQSLELSSGKSCLVSPASSWDSPHAHRCLTLEQDPCTRMENVLLTPVSLTSFINSYDGSQKATSGISILKDFTCEALFPSPALGKGRENWKKDSGQTQLFLFAAGKACQDTKDEWKGCPGVRCRVYPWSSLKDDSASLFQLFQISLCSAVYVCVLPLSQKNRINFSKDGHRVTIQHLTASSFFP